MKVCYVFSLELPHRGDSNEYIQHTISNMKQKLTRKLSKKKCLQQWDLLFGTPERVRNSRGKRVIGVRATEVLR